MTSAPGAASEHRTSLTTIDGLTLTADLALPATPWAAVAVAHPHPLYGGDRHNAVVSALYRALAGAGVAVVRFDFRGVGESEGEHDEGRGERLDVAAAVELLAGLEIDGPLVTAGYSFGARTAADVVDARITAWLLVAPPLGRTPGEPLAGSDHRRKHVLVAEHDQYCPPAAAAAASATWLNTDLVTVPMADHFLAGALATVAESAVTFVRDVAGR